MSRGIAILGGGMGGLAAAWRLSEPGWAERAGPITVYQRGVRLGGKAASSRGVHARVEEHGLHVWLGYYDNAFAMVRQCYGELDREVNRPDCPIRSFAEAFFPSDDVGLFEPLARTDGSSGPNVPASWDAWLGAFTPNDLEPGDPRACARSFTPVEVIRRSVRLLADFTGSIDRRELPVVSMSGSRRPPAAPAPLAAGLVRGFVASAYEVLDTLDPLLRGTSNRALSRPATLRPLLGLLGDACDQLRRFLGAGLLDDPASQRMWHLVSVVLAQVRGLVADGVVADPSRIRALNDEDYRDWTMRHGAHPDAANGPLIGGLYDLVFGFRDGDPRRPGFGAGLGVFLSAKTFFDYKGSVFWKMAAGMGDTVIAPLYEALVARGVRFEFLTRVDQLRLGSQARSIERIEVTRQAEVRGGAAGYEPLVEVGGLRCFRRDLDPRQLLGVPAAGLDGELYESQWWSDTGARHEVLRRGTDFDRVVFAIPVGMAPQVTGELMAAHTPWRRMCEGVATVATEALQLWLREDEASLGWPVTGSTMTGFDPPFDTWASMPQLRARERWPVGQEPATIAYFCSVLPEAALSVTGDGRAAGPPGSQTVAVGDSGGDDDPGEVVRAHAEEVVPGHPGEVVRAHAEEFVASRLRHLLPGVADPDSGRVRWDLLCGPPDAVGPDRLESQYLRANVDPSDRYVQSLPGTDHLRLASDESGFTNMVLAGDWTDNGVNAGCIEAAVLSGLQAANALLGRERTDGILGVYLHDW